MPFRLRSLALAPLLLAAGILAAQAPAADPRPPRPQEAPRIYRWKDAKGKLYITTTPPPPGAQVLGLPPEQNVKATAAPDARRPPGPVQLSAPANQPLSEAQRGFWQNLAQELGDARAKGDRSALESATDRLLNDSFWGSGLWILPAIPGASFLLLVLLGWLLAAGLKGAARGTVGVVSVVLGLCAASVTLTHFVFRAQARRLGANLTLLQLNLGGGKTLSAEHKSELEARVRAIEEGTAPFAAPWKFPKEAADLKESLRQMVVDP